MKRLGSVASLTAVGVASVLLVLGFSGARTSAADTQVRVRAPFVACDSCSPATASASATSSASPSTTSTASPSPTVTATPSTSATPTTTATPTVTATPTPTASPTTTATTCGAANATITALDKVGESVSVTGTGNLTGWYLISTNGNQRFDFPQGFTLAGTVLIRSAVAQFANSSSQLWWTAASQWNNSQNDDAVLYDCLGTARSTFDDGQ
ncbi:MAG: hypothetical protein ACKVT1_08945 [Dehalococcoidia bacterium]